MRQTRLFGAPILLLPGLSSISPLAAQDLGKSPTRSTIPFQLRSGFLVVVNGQIGDLQGF